MNVQKVYTFFGTLCIHNAAEQEYQTISCTQSRN